MAGVFWVLPHFGGRQYAERCFEDDGEEEEAFQNQDLWLLTPVDNNKNDNNVRVDIKPLLACI